MNAKNSKPTSVLLPLYATILKDPIFVAVSKDTREMERIVQVGICSWMFTSLCTSSETNECDPNARCTNSEGSYTAVEMDIRVTGPPAQVKAILYVSISFIDINHKLVIFTYLQLRTRSCSLSAVDWKVSLYFIKQSKSLNCQHKKMRWTLQE